MFYNYAPPTTPTFIKRGGVLLEANRKTGPGPGFPLPAPPSVLAPLELAQSSTSPFHTAYQYELKAPPPRTCEPREQAALSPAKAVGLFGFGFCPGLSAMDEDGWKMTREMPLILRLTILELSWKDRAGGKADMPRC
ncbi:unnamed protein product [Symbiodinium sp. CCMP2456]|nr:unnamed protein product [Symbiodinium sp. CCMP2456]